MVPLITGTLSLISGEILSFTNLHTSYSDAPDSLVTYNRFSSTTQKEIVNLNQVSKIVFIEREQTIDGSYVTLRITNNDGRTNFSYAGLYDVLVCSTQDSIDQKKIRFNEITQIDFK